ERSKGPGRPRRSVGKRRRLSPYALRQQLVHGHHHPVWLVGEFVRRFAGLSVPSGNAWRHTVRAAAAYGLSRQAHPVTTRLGITDEECEGLLNNARRYLPPDVDERVRRHRVQRQRISTRSEAYTPYPHATLPRP